MKTLRKLKINSEKILKNEELVNLRGGYDMGSGTATCMKWMYGMEHPYCLGPVYLPVCDWAEALRNCMSFYGGDGIYVSSITCY